MRGRRTDLKLENQKNNLKCHFYSILCKRLPVFFLIELGGIILTFKMLILPFEQASYVVKFNCHEVFFLFDRKCHFYNFLSTFYSIVFLIKPD